MLALCFLIDLIDYDINYVWVSKLLGQLGGEKLVAQ